MESCSSLILLQPAVLPVACPPLLSHVSLGWKEPELLISLHCLCGLMHIAGNVMSAWAYDIYLSGRVFLASENVCQKIMLLFVVVARPLEAIFVIFGRRALTFFFVWKVLEKYEKWHHFCAHSQWWSPWRRKNVEKEHLAPLNLTFLLIAIDRNGFHRMKEKGKIYKSCLRFFNFCLRT